MNLVAFMICCLLKSCSNTVVSAYTLIPEPQSFSPTEQGEFQLNSNTKILYIAENKNSERNALFLSEWIQEITKLNLVVSPVESDSDKSSSAENTIIFRRDDSVKREGFKLDASKERIMISSSDEAGAFYGIQLLRKTMLTQPSGQSTVIFPGVVINDYPTNSYRGAMLDVGRNFFTVEQVKRFIDLLALHQLNYFHWHLTEDQGWRIEIKKHPELTRLGAWSGEGTNKRGGYYAQGDIQEVVKYAAQRYITIIPEIDMPGHSLAALAAYPQLGCTGGPYQVSTAWGGVHHDVLCVGNEFSMQFVKDVLQEVAALFPAPYIHIGGDEAPRDRWEACLKCQASITKKQLKDTDKRSAEDLLQGWFNVQMATHLKQFNKQMIGWDEVLSGEISPETVVMTWRGFGRGVEAVRRGNPVIFSSNSYFYFNNYQATDMEHEPKSTGGFVPMQRVYEAPIPPVVLNSEEQQKMMGAEVCLWSSFIADNERSDYMMLPRLAAFSELVWKGKDRAGYRNFLERLSALLTCYEQLGYQYAPHFFDVSAAYQANADQKQLTVGLESVSDTDIYYTLDGTEPTRKAQKYTEPICINQTATLQVRAYLPNGLQSDLLMKEVSVNKVTFAPITMLTTVGERYQGDGGRVLVDGVRSDKFHTTGLWVGCNTDHIVVVVDLKSIQAVKEVSVSSLTDLSSWIMGPAAIEVLLSDDGTHYTCATRKKYEPADGKSEDKLSIVSVLPLDEGKVDT